MDFHEAITKRMLDAAAITNIVQQKVNWLERPQGEDLPAITLQVVSDPRPSHLKGLDGARSTRLQVDCWAETAAQAIAMAKAAIATLIPPATIDGKKFGNARVDGQRDLGETVGDGSFIHRQSVDFIIWHAGE